MNPVAEAKACLRRQIRSEVARLSEEERERASARACALLCQQPVWTNSRVVLLYAPLPGELDIATVLEQALAGGKTAALLRYDAAQHSYTPCRIEEPGRDLRTGPYGVREPHPGCQPVDLKQLDLTLVPGVVFSVDGGRIGRGKGYYDRLLPLVSGVKCGVAFDEQLTHAVPLEAHDVRLDCILTPTRWLRIAG